MITLTAYQHENELGRIERLKRVAGRYNVGTGAPLKALHDHKGCLFVNFACGDFSDADERDIRAAWEAEGEHDVNLYVNGEYAWGDVAAANPFAPGVMPFAAA